MDVISNSINVPPSKDSKDLYHQLNYIEDSQFLNAAKYLNSIADPSVVVRAKPTGVAFSDADYAFQNENDNFMCKEGKIFSYSAIPRTCNSQTNSHTVLVSPPILNSNKKYTNLTSKAIADASSKEITIKFFVKFLGLTYLTAADLTKFNSLNDEFYFFRYGTGLSIVIKKVSSTSLALKLYNSSNVLVAQYDNFDLRIGMWTFIALSYSTYHTDNAVKLYYPEKLNWQVQNKLIQTNAGTYANINIADLLTFTIPKEITALWTRLMVSYNYFTGFMGIYSNSGTTTGLTYTILKKTSTADVLDIIKGSAWNNCLTATYFDNLGDYTFNCVDDHDFVLIEESNNYNCAYKGLDDTACFANPRTNCPLGFFDNNDDFCSCSNVDKKLMLISKNDNKNFCKRKLIIKFFKNF